MTTTTTTYPPLNQSTYSVRVEFYEPTDITSQAGKSYYLFSATVVDSANMPKEIFLHQRRATGNISSPTVDEFISVAGPFDLTMVPSVDPDARGFIRKDTLQMLLTSVNTYTAVYAEIDAAIARLCQAMTELNNAQLTSVKVFSSPVE
jgi:hypothetical protein